MSAKAKRMLLTRPSIMFYGDKGTQSFEVIVLAVSGVWAMVRRPGCVPFVEHVKNLSALGAVVGGDET